MRRANVTARNVPRPLDGTTNGHAAGSEQVLASDYPSSSSEEEDEQTFDKVDRPRLRSFTPLQLIDARNRANEKYLFLSLLLFRSVVALITSRTVFAPDEHWQSLEIAHRIVFGYGFETWEWRDPRSTVHNKQGWGNGPIRSPIYPGIFVIPYWILAMLGLDDTILLVSGKYDSHLSKLIFILCSLPLL